MRQGNVNLVIKIESCLKLWAEPQEGRCLAAGEVPACPRRAASAARPSCAGCRRARRWEARGLPYSTAGARALQKDWSGCQATSAARSDLLASRMHDGL